MTANTRKFLLFVATLLLLTPALATLLDVGPMGYHDGTALAVRLIGVLLATASLAAAVGIGAYIYWLRVIHPAPRSSHAASVSRAHHPRQA